MNKIMPKQYQAYKSIIESKKNYGVYRKTCFHLHTPASYDYKLLNSWDEAQYKNATDDQIYNLCIERNLFPKDHCPLENIEYDNKFFNNRKEFLSYLLLAQSIINNGIEIAVITDHNSISGYKKTKKAIDLLYQSKRPAIYPILILGIEITCADKLHVVGIFDENKSDIFSIINNWLTENLITENEGTYKTSLDVLNFIKSQNAIGYIAHIDSSDIFKPDYFSNAYKKRLFSEESLTVIGTKNPEKIDSTLNRIKNFRSSYIKVVLDNDSHDIESLDYNNFWLKGSTRNFFMIKEALNDYDISVSFKSESNKSQYIKGMYINYNPKGFLCGKNETDFCITFSNALNCIIGGRGTGKSSILEMIEYVLSQRCSNEDMLRFLCDHGNTWIIYHYNNADYLIEMRMPGKTNPHSNVLKYFIGNSTYYKNRQKYYFFDSEKVAKTSFSQYLSIYKIITCGESIYLDNVQNKRELINKFFDAKYSVNELVNTASTERINDFIYKTMFDNKNLSDINKVIRCRKTSGLMRVLNDTKDILEKRKEEIYKIIDPFNKALEKKLRIVYSQNDENTEPDFDDWLFDYSYRRKAWYKNYNITNGALLEYLHTLNSKLGILKFLPLVLNLDVINANSFVNILSFCTPLTQDMIDDGIIELNATNTAVFMKELFLTLITNDNIHKVTAHLKEYISNIENFTLEFNVNNKEGGNNKAIFKNVSNLSLGQKVVAMFTFILGYSDYSKDFRPLLIDQPEDNLDNQYIYKNLVHQLREIKEKRQVIIATHNATIVTNAKADQVSVMNSDYIHGWIEKTGYPGETSIKKHIINHLEGGKESFKHKMKIYEEALK